MNLYTTNLEVSKRIKEIVGEMESEYCRLVASDGDRVMKRPTLPTYKYFDQYPCFLLSELPEVLKKVGDKLGWSDNEETGFHADGTKYTRDEWLVNYLQCCELHALGQNVDDYLMELLK